jgi:hypothetical protein
MVRLKIDRPIPLKLINACGKALGILGLQKTRINAGQLIEHAIKQSKHSNFGDKYISEGLEVFSQALNMEARLTPYGRYMISRQLHQALLYRLQIVHWCSQHPYIYKNKVREPLIIVGMPHSGANTLFRLLSEDRSMRAPLTWETHIPFPPPRVAKADTDPRITKTDIHFALMQRMAPTAHSIHPVEALTPQECYGIDAYSMQNQFWCDAFHVPAYRRWLHEQPYQGVLKSQKLFLQYLQSDFADRRWLLCSSNHLHALEDMLAVYPDAKVVHVHRNPITALAANCTYKYHLRGLYSNHVDPGAIGTEQLEYWSRTLKNTSKARLQSSIHQQQFLDVQFNELSIDPMQVIERIYRHFNFTLETTTRARMQQQLAERPEYKHPGTYEHAKEFGLDHKEHSKRFAQYCKAFKLEN